MQPWELRLLATAGQWLQLRTACEQLLKDHPSSPLLHNWLGASLAGQGDDNGALRAYKEALRLAPENAVVKENVQKLELRLLWRAGDLDRLEAMYEELALADPESDQLRNELGCLRAGRADLEGALAAFGEALQLAPQDARILQNFHETQERHLMHTRNWPQLERLCEERLRTHRKEARLHMALLSASFPYLVREATLVPTPTPPSRSATLDSRQESRRDTSAYKPRLPTRATPTVMVVAGSNKRTLLRGLGLARERLGDFEAALVAFEEAARHAPGEAHRASVRRMARAVRLPVVAFVEDKFPSNEQACCHVCLEPYTAADALRRLPCGHHLHRCCAGELLCRLSACPLCRGALAPRD